MNRRGFLGAILVAGAAPAIIRTPGLLMPVRVFDEPMFVIDSNTVFIRPHTFYDMKEMQRFLNLRARWLVDQVALATIYGGKPQIVIPKSWQT